MSPLAEPVPNEFREDLGVDKIFFAINSFRAPLNHRTMQALLVIDIQNDFCPGGIMEVPDGDQIAVRLPTRQ